MGLDVTAYSRLAEVPDAERDEDGELVNDDNLVDFYENSDFPGRFEGLKKGMAYRIEGDCSCLSTGYGTYSAWREELAKLAGYPAEMREQYGRQVESYCR